MQYTKKQLDRMDDVQLTLAVAKKLGLKTQVYTNRHSSFVEIKNEYNSWDCFEPCDRWDDVMPISISEWISFDTHGNGVGKYTAYSYGGTLTAVNKNLRRAICEVFLMMEKE